MFTLGNIITLALCVALVLVFRQLDANNKSIDKVKRFIDAAKGDMDKYFDARNKSLQDAAVDLDTKQTHAIAAVHRLETFEKDFAARMQETQQSIASLADVEQKITSYDSTIKNLVAMTSRAEENLAHLSAQSKQFDATFKRIKEIQDKIAQIEKAIPELTDHFEKQNLAQLQEIGAHLLDDYNARAAAVGQQFETYIEKCNVLFKQIDDQINASFDSAKHKATVLEDSVFKQLQEQAEQRKQDYIASVGERNDALRKSIESQIAETQDLTKQFKSQLRLEMSSYEDSVRSDMQNISSKFQDTLQMLDNRVSDFEKTSVNRIEEFNARLDSNDQRIELTFNDTERKINVFKEDIKQNMKTASANFEDLNGELAAKTADLQKEFAARTAELQDEFASKTGELQGKFKDLESQLQSTADEKIREIETTLHGQIAGLETQMATSYDQVSGDLEKKNTELLSEIATRFEAYKSDVMYHFKGFEKFSADVNLLEEQLRRSMDDVKTSVEGDFSAFTADQRTKQANFEKEIADSRKEIVEGFKSVEHDLGELKAKATGNVAEELKAFESEFLDDLNKKGESVNVELRNWTEAMENKLNTLASASEDDRRKIEVQYSDDLKARLAEFAERFKEQTGRFETQLGALDSSLQQKLAEYEQSLKDFVAQSNTALDEARVSSDDHVKAALETHAAEIQEQIGKQNRELAAQIKAVFADVDSTREKTEISLESVRTDFATWRDRLTQQCNEYRESFDEKLKGLQTTSSELIGQVNSSFTMDIENYTAKVREEKELIAKQLADLREEMDHAVTNYNARATDMTADFKKSYETMLEETNSKIRECNLEADQKMRELKTQAQEVREHTEATQEKMRLKLQTDANSINLQMDDLEKRLKGFVTQTQVFDKADDLKEKLETDISALRTEISRVETFRQTAAELEQQFAKLRRMEEDVSEKLNKFGTEKKRIEVIENDFNSLMNMSNTIEQKISDLKDSNDGLQQLQLDIRRYQEGLADIGSRFDRLEKKNIVLEKTMEGVDTSFENLQKIEKRIAQCNAEVQKLPDQVTDIQKSVDKLLDANARVNEAVERLASLDVIIKDTETRITEMQKAREWVARTETRMADITKQAQEQVRLMSDLAKSDSGHGGGKGGGGSDSPSMSQRETVVKLNKQGWAVDEIANRMHLSRGEVELILELNTGVK